MPNPFPGMNPYLEERSGWQGLHTLMIARMVETLNTVLPPDYIANTEVRCLITRTGREIEPDVFIRESQVVAPSQRPSGIVVLDPPKATVDPALDDFDLPRVLIIDPREERQAFINILRISNGRYRNAEVVTTIEILSPTNKNTQDDGYEAYKRKQDQVLASQTNLLEIDLLRAGTYSVAIPKAVLPTDRVWHYIICLHRGARPSEYAFWTRSLREPLPRIRIPLAEDDPPVGLDLQAIVNLSYNAGAYDRQIDYTQEADPPLTGEDAVWADALLRERGLRS